MVRPGEDRPGDHLIVNAPGCRPYIVYPFTAETGWTFDRSFRARDHIAKIYLTDEELEIGRRVRERLGPYVLFDPWSKHPNLRWPIEHWQKLIYPDAPWRIAFVQQDYPLGYAHEIPGAVRVPTPSFREACGLLASASAYIRGESGMCHAAAALDVPNVVIWGGCMDWEVLGGYPKQIGVGVQQTGGQPPCGSYSPCSHCKAVMASISPFEVSVALRRALAGQFQTT